MYWYLGEQSGTDVDATLDTFPGVPTEEYDPTIRERCDGTNESTVTDGHKPAND